MNIHFSTITFHHKPTIHKIDIDINKYLKLFFDFWRKNVYKYKIQNEYEFRFNRFYKCYKLLLFRSCYRVPTGITINRIVFRNVALDKKNHGTYASHFWSQGRCHFVTRAHMYYSVYSYPNVYSLKIVKHRVIFLSTIEWFFWGHLVYIKSKWTRLSSLHRCI